MFCNQLVKSSGAKCSNQSQDKYGGFCGKHYDKNKKILEMKIELEEIKHKSISNINSRIDNLEKRLFKVENVFVESYNKINTLIKNKTIIICDKKKNIKKRTRLSSTERSILVNIEKSKMMRKKLIHHRRMN